MPGGRRANGGPRLIVTATASVSATVPPAPPWLPVAARKHYRALAKHLQEAGVATRLDGTVLAQHCAAVHHMAEAERAIAEHGSVFVDVNGRPMPSPHVKLRRDAYAEAVRTAVELGLTPSSRGRVKVDATAANGAASVSPIGQVMRLKAVPS